MKLSKKDKAFLEKQLGFHKSGIEYTDERHGENVYQSEVKSDIFGNVYR